MITNPNKTCCTLCGQDTNNKPEVSGSKVVDSKYIDYQLCTGCYSKRPKIKFNRGHKNTDESDSFWQVVIEKATLANLVK